MEQKQSNFFGDLVTPSKEIPPEVLIQIKPPVTEKKEKFETDTTETHKLSTSDQVLQILGHTDSDIVNKVEALTSNKDKPVTVSEALGILLGGDAIDAKSR